MLDLDRILAAIASDGWVLETGTIEDVDTAVVLAGYRSKATRRGGDSITSLKPTPASSAHPRSLSAQFGLGEFPLHTDGAHLRVPPDVIVLASTAPSATPTLLWRVELSSPTRVLANFRPDDDVRHGVFLVNNGRDSFFTTAFSDGRYRYDAGCMTPCDDRARTAARRLTDGAKSHLTHTWVGGNQLLFIDNRKVLHGRGKVAAGDENRTLQRLAFNVSKESV